MDAEAKKTLELLKKHNSAFCPVHKKPWMVPHTKQELAGTITTCSICERKIQRADTLWINMIV